MTEQEKKSIFNYLNGASDGLNQGFKDAYNQALEDFKTELIKIYNKRYMHDIYIDDIRGIVEQLKR